MFSVTTSLRLQPTKILLLGNNNALRQQPPEKQRRNDVHLPSTSSSSSSKLVQRKLKEQHEEYSRIMSTKKKNEQQQKNVAASSSKQILLSSALSSAFQRIKQDPISKVLLAAIARGHHRNWPMNFRENLFESGIASTELVVDQVLASSSSKNTDTSEHEKNYLSSLISSSEKIQVEKLSRLGLLLSSSSQHHQQQKNKKTPSENKGKKTSLPPALEAIQRKIELEERREKILKASFGSTDFLAIDKKSTSDPPGKILKHFLRLCWPTKTINKNVAGRKNRNRLMSISKRIQILSRREQQLSRKNENNTNNDDVTSAKNKLIFKKFHFYSLTRRSQLLHPYGISRVDWCFDFLIRHLEELEMTEKTEIDSDENTKVNVQTASRNIAECSARLYFLLRRVEKLSIQVQRENDENSSLLLSSSSPSSLSSTVNSIVVQRVDSSSNNNNCLLLSHPYHILDIFPNQISQRVLYKLPKQEVAGNNTHVHHAYVELSPSSSFGIKKVKHVDGADFIVFPPEFSKRQNKLVEEQEQKKLKNDKKRSKKEMEVLQQLHTLEAVGDDVGEFEINLDFSGFDEQPAEKQQSSRKKKQPKKNSKKLQDEVVEESKISQNQQEQFASVHKNDDAELLLHEDSLVQHPKDDDAAIEQMKNIIRNLIFMEGGNMNQDSRESAVLIHRNQELENVIQKIEQRRKSLDAASSNSGDQLKNISIQQQQEIAAANLLENSVTVMSLNEIHLDGDDDDDDQNAMPTMNSENINNYHQTQSHENFHVHDQNYHNNQDLAVISSRMKVNSNINDDHAPSLSHLAHNTKNDVDQNTITLDREIDDLLEADEDLFEIDDDHYLLTQQNTRLENAKEIDRIELERLHQRQQERDFSLKSNIADDNNKNPLFFSVSVRMLLENAKEILPILHNHKSSLLNETNCRIVVGRSEFPNDSNNTCPTTRWWKYEISAKNTTSTNSDDISNFFFNSSYYFDRISRLRAKMNLESEIKKKQENLAVVGKLSGILKSDINTNEKKKSPATNTIENLMERNTEKEKSDFSQFFSEGLWKRIVCLEKDQAIEHQQILSYTKSVAERIMIPSELYHLASDSTKKEFFATSEEKQFDLYFARVLNAVLVDAARERRGTEDDHKTNKKVAAEKKSTKKRPSSMPRR